MSVIVAFISNRGGVVASDGRKFSPVRFENGVAVEHSSIISDEFDKTFSLYDGNIIGAYCGLMSFSTATVADHIINIVGDIPQHDMELSSIAEKIKTEMTTMLSAIDDSEVIRSCRKIDLLLVAGRNLTRERLNIASIRFLPVEGVITSEINFVEAASIKQYYVYGEDRARTAAAHVLERNRAPNSDAKFLKKLAQDAIRTGIFAAGPHSYSPEKACGGQIFTRRTYY